MTASVGPHSSISSAFSYIRGSGCRELVQYAVRKITSLTLVYPSNFDEKSASKWMPAERTMSSCSLVVPFAKTTLLGC